MLNFLINYWQMIIVAIAIVIVAGEAIYRFIKMSPKKQKAKVQAWLLYAVTRAEEKLGSGTGPLKLRFVYDLFLKRFPVLARVITFEQFSDMVDKALNELTEILKAKPRLKEAIGGKEDESN